MPSSRACLIGCLTLLAALLRERDMRRRLPPSSLEVLELRLRFMRLWIWRAARPAPAIAATFLPLCLERERRRPLSELEYESTLPERAWCCWYLCAASPATVAPAAAAARCLRAPGERDREEELERLRRRV